MLLECLSKVFDPRRSQGKVYKLPYILLFSILAILSGATSYRKIQRFIHAHRERLNELFNLNWKRAPAHTSIRYILQGLETEELEKAFREHAYLLSDQDKPLENQEYIAVDGKTLRGSFDHFEDREAAHLLSAFCQGEQIILGHLEVFDPSNEIPAVPQLIKELGLSNKVFTVDAMHCQKNTLEVVTIDPDNNLIVQVKENQPTLLEAVQNADSLSSPLSQHEEYEHTRNRMTTRDVMVFDAFEPYNLFQNGTS